MYVCVHVIFQSCVIQWFDARISERYHRTVRMVRHPKYPGLNNTLMKDERMPWAFRKRVETIGKPYSKSSRGLKFDVLSDGSW